MTRADRRYLRELLAAQSDLQLAASLRLYRRILAGREPLLRIGRARAAVKAAMLRAEVVRREAAHG